MNVNAASSTTSASASNGLSGMVSGLDTDSMVESMLSGVQSKIDKQTQQQQILGWKQDMYREVITKVNDFQDKYFSLTSSTSLRSTSLFNTMTGESDSSAVKIISSGNTAADFNVQVAQLASAASVVSSPVSTGKISSNNTASNYERNVTFSYKTGEDEDGKDVFTDVEINLTEIMDGLTKTDGKVDKQQFADAIEAKLGGTGITVDYIAKDVDDDKSYDKLTFSGDTSFKISGTSGGLGMLGYAGASSSTQDKGEDGALIDNSYTLNAGVLNPELKLNGEVTISLDGSSKKFTLDEGKTLYDIKDDIEKAFGSGISITQNGNKTEITANGTGRSVSVTGSEETLKTIGLTNANSATSISTTSALKDIQTNNSSSIGSGKLTINGTEIEYSENDTVVQLLSKVNNSSAGVKMVYNTLTDSFAINNKNTGADFELNISDDGNLLSTLGFDMSGNSVNKVSSNYTTGQNAQFKVNGTQLERAGNTVSYGGVTFEMKNTTPSGETVNITSERNVDKITSVLKDFVNDYNTLIADLNKYTHEKADYKDYPPLTSAQKKEMTEDEIKLWEEKSKTGLLRNDSDISSFLQDMRAVLYTKGSDTSLVLSNIGIDSSSEWKDYGKLSINEDTLKSALESNSTAIADMFANAETGIGKRLNDVCKKTANTSSGAPGTLVSMAGVVGKATEKDNTIYDRLQKITEKLEALKDQYDSKKEKYWSMFNTMETTISNYTSQSDYLSQLSF